MDIQKPHLVKDVHKLIERLATLSRFLSKLAEKSLPFFQILKKVDAFEWTEECQMEFKDLKAYLSSSPILSKPEKGEVLYIYLVVADREINLVLLREDELKVQQPIYYVSKALPRSELRYSMLENTTYTLVITAKKLAAYFQLHQIQILIDQPFRILHS